MATMDQIMSIIGNVDTFTLNQHVAIQPFYRVVCVFNPSGLVHCALSACVEGDLASVPFIQY
jgi:hypothetical protein